MKSKKIIIIGGAKAGGVASCIDHNRKHYNDYEYEVMGILNDFETGSINGYPILGKSRDCARYFDEDNIYFSYAIHVIGKNKLGDELFQELNIPEEKLATVIHKSAIILDGAILDPGVTVLALSYISSAHLKTGVYVSPQSTICHGSEVGPLSYISMGSIIGSVTKIGRSVSVGMGAKIIEKSVVGDFAVVAAGAVVNGYVPDCSIYGGIPAKFMRNIDI